MLTALMLVALQAAGVAPSPLPKAEAERRVTERFADLDLNEDGMIERDEVRARFDLDSSAGAVLSAAQRAKKAGDARAPVDSSQPGFTKADAWFAAVDADGDGRINRAELARYLGANREDLGIK